MYYIICNYYVYTANAKKQLQRETDSNCLRNVITKYTFEDKAY